MDMKIIRMRIIRMSKVMIMGIEQVLRILRIMRVLKMAR